jgi:hypothetical protein
MTMRTGDLETIEQNIAELRLRLAAIFLHDNDDLREEICALYTRRNAFTPPCRMPPDILLRILELVIHVEQKEKEESSQGSNDWKDIAKQHVSWVRILSTCTHIRAVALSFPSLWTNIDLNRKSKWIKMCLARSASVLLSICCRGGSKSAVLPNRKLASLFMRSKSICLADITPEVTTVLHESLARPMPHLRVLHYLSLPEDRFTLRQQFLAGETSSLTKLVLGHLILHSQGLHFPNLVFLGLSKVDVENSIERILRLVSTAPRLRELYISNIAITQSTTKLPVAHLPDLEVLDVRGSLKMLDILVPKLPLPGHAFRVSLQTDSPRTHLPFWVQLIHGGAGEQWIRERLIQYLLGTLSTRVNSSATLSWANEPWFGGMQIVFTVRYTGMQNTVLTYTDFGRDASAFEAILESVVILRIPENMTSPRCVFDHTVALVDRPRPEVSRSPENDRFDAGPNKRSSPLSLSRSGCRSLACSLAHAINYARSDLSTTDATLRSPAVRLQKYALSCAISDHPLTISDARSIAPARRSHSVLPGSVLPGTSAAHSGDVDTPHRLSDAQRRNCQAQHLVEWVRS